MTTCNRCGTPTKKRTIQTIGTRTLQVCGRCVTERENRLERLTDRLAAYLKKPHTP